MPTSEPNPLTPDSPESHTKGELRWLSLARRLLWTRRMNRTRPRLGRVRFAGIMGMIDDGRALGRF